MHPKRMVKSDQNTRLGAGRLQSVHSGVRDYREPPRRHLPVGRVPSGGGDVRPRVHGGVPTPPGLPPARHRQLHAAEAPHCA